MLNSASIVSKDTHFYQMVGWTLSDCDIFVIYSWVPEPQVSNEQRNLL